MYTSKVVVICWASVYLVAFVAALAKRQWLGFRFILAGALMMLAGIGASACFNHPLDALTLAVALLLAAFFTLKGIVNVFGR